MRLPPDGLSTPFRIGLKPLDPAEWIDVDERLADYLAEKRRIGRDFAAQSFAAEPGTEAAQAEVLALLADHLTQRFAAIYRREGDAIAIGPAGRRVALAGADPPLLRAAQLVQEDLVLMRRGPQGWRLAAASLCFPSSWRLADKFGRPMHEVHGPVPGFGDGTRNAGLIDRMFDNLRPEMPMLRWNWSLFSDPALFHPESRHPAGPRFGAAAESAFLRIERQTLRRLAQSGDILFTIRIHVDPLAALERHADGAHLARAMIGQLDAMSEEQAAYKGLAADRALLAARLARIAETTLQEES